MPLNLRKLYIDVFHPEPDERVLVMTDVPHAQLRDHGGWAERRQMAADWREAFISLGREIGFSVLPLVAYPATGAHNRELPWDEGDPMSLKEALAQATLAVVLTEYSATAPLVLWAKTHEDFRAATLPGVARRTERTALAADYAEVARRCEILAAELRDAVSARVVFSTGHEWFVDLRYRDVRMDNGQLPRHKPGVSLINLPSGESFQVPYEGEREGEPSRTEGEIPVQRGDELVVLHVKANRIVEVHGSGPEAENWQAYFDADPARANIAEFAFGCNPLAVVWGNILEDEKAGFHWAFGRSEHLGGIVRPEDFSSPAHVVHEDIVYARESPITISRLTLEDGGGYTSEIIRDGEYIVFG